MRRGGEVHEALFEIPSNERPTPSGRLVSSVPGVDVLPFLGAAHHLSASS